MDIYLVGGAVRDELLGLPVSDHDWVVVSATVEQMLAADYHPVGKDFPVFLHPKTKEEYALARTEHKTGKGYRGFAVYAEPDVTLEQDLLRRDLTINAIAKSQAGELVDPYAGQQDLAAGILRHVSPAFTEDPVRILRVARFLARYTQAYCGKDFTLAEETRELMQAMSQSGEVDHLVAERSWQEMLKALQESAPERFFETLQDTDALHAVFNGNEKQLAQSLSALRYACSLSTNPTVRFAALCSSLSSEQAMQLCDQLKTPSEFRDLARLVIEQLPQYSKVSQLPAPKVLSLIKATDAYRKPERFELFLWASEAACRALPHHGDKPHPQREYLQSAYHTTATITAKDMTRLRLEGKAIAEEIDRHRAAALVKVKRTYRWSYFN